MIKTMIGAASALFIGLFAVNAQAVDIQEVKSDGGVTAWLVEENAIPIITITMQFKGGASLDPADKLGRATLMAGLLEEGAGDLDDAAFARRVEETASRFSFSASRDSITVSASMLADRKEESLELLRLALQHPRFDQDALNRVKAQMVSNIRQKDSDPDSMASRAFFAALFPDDPYGRDADGVEETIIGLTPDDMRTAHKELMTRDRVYVGVVGAVSADELKPILDRLLAKMPMSQTPLPAPVEPAAKSGVDVITYDSPQSAVLFGHRGILFEDPDFLPAYVLNYILGGGGFESRLMTEIREKRGLAYSTYSYLSPMDRAGLYIGGVATRNDAVAESIRLVRQEWRKLAEEGVDEETLERAKTYLTGAFALRFDSNAKIARYLVGAQSGKLGIDYINQRNALVENVSVDDIKRVAKRLLKPEELYFVVVGKPENL